MRYLRSVILYTMLGVASLSAQDFHDHQPGDSISYRIHFQNGDVKDINELVVSWDRKEATATSTAAREGYATQFTFNVNSSDPSGIFSIMTKIPDNLATGDYSMRLTTVLTGGGQFVYRNEAFPILHVRNHKDIVKPSVTIEEVPQHQGDR